MRLADLDHNAGPAALLGVQTADGDDAEGAGMTDDGATPAKRLLVCGGRDYSDQAMLFGVLDMIAEQQWIYTIIQGGADGADRLARLWCHSRLCRFENYPADWRKHGRAAGPIRNQKMIDEGRPTLVIAFPGGRGTADMVRRAKVSGIPVREITRLSNHTPNPPESQP